MTHQQSIASGKHWTVYPDDDPDVIMFEGSSRTACIKFLKDSGQWRMYKRGVIRLGQTIWEPELPPTQTAANLLRLTNPCPMCHGWGTIWLKAGVPNVTETCKQCSGTGTKGKYAKRTY